MEEAIDLNGFIQAVIERSFRWVQDAQNGLTEEQLRYQPAPESNSIIWLVWHSSRVKDRITANVVGEDEVWVTGGWAEQFGLGIDATGVGDNPEQVAGFPVGADLVFGYAEAAHSTTIQRLSRITPAQFGQPPHTTSQATPDRPGKP